MTQGEHCPVEATLELIGGKYKALILWHLSEHALRFSQLRKLIHGVTPKMLTQQGGVFPDRSRPQPDAHSHRHAGLGQRISA